MTGVAACCIVNSHGAGWPISANATPLTVSATPTTANASNRRPIWLFDTFMSFALPLIIPWAPRIARDAERSPRAKRPDGAVKRSPGPIAGTPKSSLSNHNSSSIAMQS